MNQGSGDPGWKVALRPSTAGSEAPIVRIRRLFILFPFGLAPMVAVVALVTPEPSMDRTVALAIIGAATLVGVLGVVAAMRFVPWALKRSVRAAGSGSSGEQTPVQLFTTAVVLGVAASELPVLAAFATYFSTASLPLFVLGLVVSLALLVAVAPTKQRVTAVQQSVTAVQRAVYTAAGSIVDLQSDLYASPSVD